MKAKRLRTKVENIGAGQGALGGQCATPKPPAFVLRLPLSAKLEPNMKSSQTVFEKVVNGRRFTVVQSVIANGRAKAQGTAGAAIRWLADWPAIPAASARTYSIH